MVSLPLADVDPSEWDAIITARQNVLLHGAASPVDAVLSALRPHLRQPIFKWRPDTDPSLPRLAEGTLVLEHATTCPQMQQQALWEWLNDADRHVQVIVVTDQSLYDLVERGAFLTNLYYRLNTLYLDVRFLESAVPK